MIYRRSLAAAAVWIALLAAWPGVAAAQTGAASITGLVTDESGAPVPGVTVTATNQATNVTYIAVSNEAGNYTIAGVPVGTYVVKAELTGFRTTTRTPVTFEAKQVARLDFRMERRPVQESVEVTGTPPILQTEIGDGRRSDLGQHRAVAAAQRPQHRPAGAAPAGHDRPTTRAASPTSAAST